MRFISDKLDHRGDVVVGVELDREVGDTDGTAYGTRFFRCSANHGAFVRQQSIKPFSTTEYAACVIQNMWRRWQAVNRFRGLMNAATWNLLDNNEEWNNDEE